MKEPTIEPTTEAKTTNVPERNYFPFKLYDGEYEQVVAWMRERPAKQLDECFNRRTRWEYRINDDGMVRFLSVVDLCDGTVLKVEPNWDNV